MLADHERTLQDIEEMKKDFKELKAEMESSSDFEPELKEDVEYMSLSIDVLLEELDHIKTEKDLTPKRNIKIDALLTWVGQFLPDLVGGADFEEDDEDDFDDEDEDEFEDEEEGEEEEEGEDNKPKH